MSNRKSIKDLLNKEWVFWDGGIGTLLQAKGLKSGELPETWNLTKPDEIFDLYKQYLLAGSTVINTNTFGANRIKYPENLEEIITSSVDIAIKARDEHSSNSRFISLDIGPTGKLLKPLGDLDFEEAVSIFGEVASIGEKAGADLVLIETMSDTYELKAAVLGVKENCSLPICATVTFDGGGKLLTGGTVKTCVALLEGLGVDALGVNCSLGPKELIPIVKELVEEASIPVIVTPNAGLPRTDNGKTVYDIGPAEFSDLMAEIAAIGVQVLGGCCGTTPEHIRYTVEKCRAIDFVPSTKKNKTYVTSFAQAVEIGWTPRIIGERINPTGKKALKEALKTNDITYILREGIKQEESGADILDVNVGLPELDEGQVMAKVITELQAVTPLPLQIDTASVEALERGLRIYNGKALVNSVNGKQESMDTVFPLVAKYGGTVVALTLDEEGIPETSEGRLAIAEKIVREAAKYGIEKKDIIIDGLTLAISSGKGMGVTTLETIKRVKEELGLSTILGVSNVSFGLPAREIINSSFLSMAMACGLSCAIINPGNEAIMNAFRSSMALLDFDENCGDYIERYKDYAPQSKTSSSSVPAASSTNSVSPDSGEPNSTSAVASRKKSTSPSFVAATSGSISHVAGATSLRENIERGLSDAARISAEEELKKRDALDIINEDLIPALDYVGQGFEKGEIFLPQLLMSAEATKSAFSVIKESLPEKSQKAKGKIIVATVKGDIHDIGKNIVKVLLDNYGFQVIDLGRDVPPEDIVDAAIKNSIKLVGLSALMTTTVPSMQETIKVLREKSPKTKVVVSGAVLTQEYADMMGADHYAKDAMATVRYAENILER